jgi:signal peptidase I
MNFALLMLVLLLVTGAVWLLDIFFLRKHRGRDAGEPWWVEYPKSFFPIILLVFLLRSFLVEPFKIPSGSMIPTLLVGDFILVNKFTYGIRLPVINRKIIDISQPRHGEVMVVGLPGDHVEYRNKRLSINGALVPVEAVEDFQYVDGGLSFVNAMHFRETLGEHRHSIIINPEASPLQLAGVKQFPQRENCDYNEREFSCVVPPGHYFMMGDNRDSSSDSRYWGFVPEENIVGKAFLVWWNFGELKRIGNRIN